MKAIYDTIHPDVSDDGLPARWTWRGQTWTLVETIDQWRLQQGWWRPAGTERRDYLLVEAAAGADEQATMEIFLRGDEWVLARVLG